MQSKPTICAHEQPSYDETLQDFIRTGNQLRSRRRNEAILAVGTGPRSHADPCAHCLVTGINRLLVKGELIVYLEPGHRLLRSKFPGEDSICLVRTRGRISVHFGASKSDNGPAICRKRAVPRLVSLSLFLGSFVEIMSVHFDRQFC